MDRVKINLSYNIEKMFAEYQDLQLNTFEYYNVVQLRGPAHLVDTSLPFPPPALDYADGSWTKWMDTPNLNDSIYLKSIVDYFKTHTKVTLVRLLRLAPHSIVKEHTDPTLALEVDKSVIRLTIPILLNDRVQFILNGTEVPMKAGECWYLKLSDPHKVINNGSTERVSMSIDLIPNQWVRDLIENA